tara:strand:- start:516 stop:698 length:183 start_codon:yes stop_codon:yes gene_type:complete
MKKIIKDDFGNDYEIKNLNSFINHLSSYHTKNGLGDNSIHEENGRYFTVTEEFYKKVLRL